jgi:hypothetical protein
MKRVLFGTLLALGLASSGQAATETKDVDELPAFEAVRSIWTYGGFHDFDVIDNDTLILWTNPFKPYLVELRIPSHDLRFAHVIAVDSTNNRTYSRFDSVRVAGFRYPIERIYKLSREEARQLKEES